MLRALSKGPWCRIVLTVTSTSGPLSQTLLWCWQLRLPQPLPGSLCKAPPASNHLPPATQPGFQELRGFLSKPSWHPLHKNLGSAAPHHWHVNAGPSLPTSASALAHLLPPPRHHSPVGSAGPTRCYPANRISSRPSLCDASHRSLLPCKMPFPLGPGSPRDTRPCLLPKNCFQVASCAYLALAPRWQSPSRMKPGAPFE